MRDDKDFEAFREDLLKETLQAHVRIKHAVNDVMAGGYRSAFRGRGMEFEEVREYQPGDDVRSIDWNVTARMDRPYVKLYREERELTVMLMVDISASLKFGSRKKLKNRAAAMVAGLVALTAIRNNDKVGLILFTDRVEKYIPPKKTRGHGWRVIREIISVEPEGRGTDLSQALDYLGHVMRKRCICFLISDFIASGYEKSLRLSNKRHDMIALTITDPREVELPMVGFVEFEDAETGEILLIDTRDPDVLGAYRDLQRKEAQERQRLFRSMGLEDPMLFSTDDLVDAYSRRLLAFFRRREKSLYR